MAFVSGYSVAATAIGEPDLGLLTQAEMIDRARRICLSVPIPIIVNADTGYGNPLNVHRTVVELIAAGAAGCFLVARRDRARVPSTGTTVEAVDVVATTRPPYPGWDHRHRNPIEAN